MMTHRKFSLLTLVDLILTAHAQIIPFELIWSEVNLEQNRVYNDFLSFCISFDVPSLIQIDLNARFFD